jgi:uncharacterized RDD family membrane protein YckC
VASVRQRIGGYAIDMVIFASIAMVVTVIAGLQVLLETRGLTQDPADAQVYAFLATIGLGSPVAWTILNLVTLSWRQQTGGQYVAGVRVVREDGRALSVRDAAAWWFCLNPVLFSWPMAVMTAFPLALVISLVLSRLGIVAFGVVLTLCLVAPILALVSALLDQQNRALHDRIVGVLVVPVE